VSAQTKSLDSVYPETCPHCNASMQGSGIPEEMQHLYGGATHFSRVIGIYSMDEDRTIAWRCPDCGQEWPRDN
jgi:hypothetical protein